MLTILTMLNTAVLISCLVEPLSQTVHEETVPTNYRPQENTDYEAINHNWFRVFDPNESLFI